MVNLKVDDALLLSGLEKVKEEIKKVEWQKYRTDGNLTNKAFSLSDPHFIAACEAAKIKITARQASKWRRGYGAARNAEKGAATNG